MGRPPSNGVPAFRFNANEVTEMEAILLDHNNALPSREIMIALAEKFSEAPERKGKITVQMKQIWNWFQNKRYALRAKSSRGTEDPNVMPLTRVDSGPTRVVLQPGTGSLPIPKTAPVQVPAPVPTPAQAPAPIPNPSVQPAGNAGSENPLMEFEAKSARDGAWYDVQCFLAHRNFETSNPEVQVRIVGFGPEEDEWVNVRQNVRPRSLPCEASECVAVLPGDLILCFQEGKDQALYYDAHVLDAQRRRHDVRGCRCRFLVRYEHDQAEEIVPLRKVCRRPQTDFRLQQLHAMAKADKPKTNVSATPRPNNPTPMSTKPVPVPQTNVATATTTTATSTSNILRINMPKPSNPGTPAVPRAILTEPTVPSIVRINPAPAPMMPKPTISRITVKGPAAPQPNNNTLVAAETGRKIIKAEGSATSGPIPGVGQGGSGGNAQG